MNTRAGEGWSGTIDGFDPVEGLGRIDGHSWYFWARPRYWTFSIAEDPAVSPAQLPALESALVGWSCEEGWGEGPADDHFPHDDAMWARIERAFAAFRDGAIPHVDRRG